VAHPQHPNRHSPPEGSIVKIIALEEHFLDLGIAKASAAESDRLSPHFAAAYDPASGLPYTPTVEELTDLGAGRLAAMDAGGVSMQVLSAMNAQRLPAQGGPELARAANDRAAAAVAAHPDRFAAFAALATAAPEAAAAELERCVRELGFVGTMIFGRTEEEFLDAPRFEPVLAAAARLGVPIYLHPGLVPRSTAAANYEGGLAPIAATRFATAAWGWHNETAVHFIHLVLSGVLDRYPRLQFILGHWGELVPFYLERLNEALPKKATGLERTFEQYLRENLYITPSGMWSQAQLQFCLQTVGAERIMFSVDYPFIGNEGASRFLAEADLPEHAKHQIAHTTAEQLFGLDA
jgi:predicted TIM-barrel fold metal-dependent hydrolase